MNTAGLKRRFKPDDKVTINEDLCSLPLEGHIGIIASEGRSFYSHHWRMPYVSYSVFFPTAIPSSEFFGLQTGVIFYTIEDDFLLPWKESAALSAE